MATVVKHRRQPERFWVGMIVVGLFVVFCYAITEVVGVR